MNKNKMLSVPAYKKIWIFKWLLKKHNCTVVFERDFFWKDSKTKTQKIWLATPKLLRKEKGDEELAIFTKEFHSAMSVRLPSKHAALSYADVLDALLDRIKKDQSDCYLVDFSWPHHKKELFLPKDTTLEELCIEFDLAWRDAFGFPLKSLKRKA